MSDQKSNKQSMVLATENELPDLVRWYLSLKRHPILLLSGDLGAGKTAFVKALLEHLGTSDAVSSPSFSIVNQYELLNGEIIYHMDLYRLETIEEAFNTGLEEYLYSGDTCLIEWPQIILDYIEEPYHQMDIEILKYGSRKFTLI